MRKLLFCVMAITALTNANAQDVPLATLQNGEETQLFYGADAFKEAMKVAENGNTITLGSGSFNAVDITKAVKIYGSGYEIRTDAEAQEAENIAYATRLVGNFSIALDSINDQPAIGLYIEGIYSNNSIMVKKHLEGASFVKCRFQVFDFWKDVTTMMTSKNVNIIHCKFADWLEPGDSQNMSVSNCIIDKLGRNLDKSTFMIHNSIVSDISDKLCAIYKNCAIRNIYRSSYNLHSIERYGDADLDSPIYSNSSIYNCVFASVNALNNVITKFGCLTKINATSLFGENGSYKYNDTYKYELTDEAKQKYLGTDGTQIGIYGGSTPFSPNLTIPRVVKKEIGSKTEGGKLKVNIKVEVGENLL